MLPLCTYTSLHHGTAAEDVPGLDWPGFVLCGVALGTLLLGMEEVGSTRTRGGVAAVLLVCDR